MTSPAGADLRALARGGSLLLAAAIGVRFLEWVFPKQPLVAVVIACFLLDLWSQNLGARWLPSPSPRPPWFAATRWLMGVGLGLGLGLVVVAFAALLGAARLRFGTASATSVALGGARTAAYAFRDELLFRGIPLALAKDHVDRRWSTLFCAILGVAPIALVPGTGPELWLLGISAGVFFALTWQLGPGGSVAWARHTGWLIAIEVVSQGGGLDIAWTNGALASTTNAAGLPAYLGAASFALATFILYRRKRRPVGA